MLIRNSSCTTLWFNSCNMTRNCHIPSSCAYYYTGFNLCESYIHYLNGISRSDREVNIIFIMKPVLVFQRPLICMGNNLPNKISYFKFFSLNTFKSYFFSNFIQFLLLIEFDNYSMVWTSNQNTRCEQGSSTPVS